MPYVEVGTNLTVKIFLDIKKKEKFNKKNLKLIC
jgi:hypothetical protein